MARINKSNNQQINVENTTPQTTVGATPTSTWDVKPISTTSRDATWQENLAYNKEFFENLPWAKATNRVWDTMWKMVGGGIFWPIGRYETQKSDANQFNKYLEENRMEKTLWGYNYTLDSSQNQTPNQWGYEHEQAQLNPLYWGGSMAGIQYTAPVQNQTQNTNSNQKWKALHEDYWHWPIDQSATQEEVVETPVQSEWWIQETPVHNTASTWTTRTYTWGKTNTTQNNQSPFRNANVNFEQYWDDSSPDKQATLWGMNEKYTWEWVKTSNLAYDPNITTADLPSDYLYWMDAQYQNSKEAWYIARRNDMIASALYNEWKTSKEDVLNFLAQQPWWNNSTEADRYNTVESIWKRLGSFVSQNETANPTQLDMSNIQPVYSDEALNNMSNDLNQSTAWTLYGKVTADQQNEIKTLEDANSVYKTMNEARINDYKNLRWMDSQAIAAAVISWAMAMDSQQMRDLMQYDPAKYEYVQQSIKQIRGQMNINSITSGDWTRNTTATNGQSWISNEITDFAINNSNSSNSTADILKSVNSTLSSNTNASSASETMASIESDMVTLQNRMKNLKKEASQVFKWDVPQYIVNAYIANRTAEIQNELSMLEQRYNAAYSRYQNEWEQTKRAAEFDLKKQELQLKKESTARNKYMDSQWLMLKRADLNWTTNWTTPLSTLSTQEASNVFQNFINTYTEGAYGWQCGTFVKKYLSQLWVSLPNISSLESKVSLVDPNITAPQEWDLVIMDSKKYPQNWHIAIVSSVDDDGTVHLLESNRDSDEKVHTTRTIKPWQSGVYGFYRPTWNNANTNISQLDGTSFVRKDWKVFNYTSQYAALDDHDRLTVKWLLDLTIDPSTLQTRYWYTEWQAQRLLNAAYSINPSWTQDDFKEMKDVVKNWTDLEMRWANDKNATAMTVAKELYDSLENLWNKKLKWWNEVVNYMKTQLSDVEYAKFLVNLNTFVAETASAMKWWNAAATDQDKTDFKEMFSPSMWKQALQAMVIQMANNLYSKNETQANYYGQKSLEKPDSIWTDEVTDWMYNDVWLTNLPKYYNYTPSYWDLDVFINGGGSATAVYTAQDILSA